MTKNGDNNYSCIAFLDGGDKCKPDDSDHEKAAYDDDDSDDGNVHVQV